MGMRRPEGDIDPKDSLWPERSCRDLLLGRWLRYDGTELFFHNVNYPSLDEKMVARSKVRGDGQGICSP